MASCLLICAVIASLAVGVFMAQGLCLLIFQMFRMHALKVAATYRSLSGIAAQQLTPSADVATSNGVSQATSAPSLSRLQQL